MSEQPDTGPVGPPPAFLVLPGTSVDISSTLDPAGRPVTMLAIRNPVATAQCPLSDEACRQLIEGLQATVDSHFAAQLGVSKPEIIIPEGVHLDR